MKRDCETFLQNSVFPFTGMLFIKKSSKKKEQKGINLANSMGEIKKRGDTHRCRH
jgi:hypothetical protein